MTMAPRGPCPAPLCACRSREAMWTSSGSAIGMTGPSIPSGTGCHFRPASPCARLGGAGGLGVAPSGTPSPRTPRDRVRACPHLLSCCALPRPVTPASPPGRSWRALLDQLCSAHAVTATLLWALSAPGVTTTFAHSGDVPGPADLQGTTPRPFPFTVKRPTKVATLLGGATAAQLGTMGTQRPGMFAYEP